MNLVEVKHDSKRQILKAIFGFDDFRPGQNEVMNALLSGRSVLTVMPTGSGKSLCYQVPALVLGGLTLVVSPLVALMQDQVSALRLAGVTADTINSSKERAENIAAWRRVTAGETRLLYLAPERLMTEPMLAALARIRQEPGPALLVLRTAFDPQETVPPYSERPDEIRLNFVRALATRERRP
jgi:ATP-dependent DNA helicase RecQ